MPVTITRTRSSVLRYDEDFYGQDASYESTQMSYQDNGDGTVTDLNTGLMWMQDAGEKMTYSEAMTFAEDFLMQAMMIGVCPRSKNSTV